MTTRYIKSALSSDVIENLKAEISEKDVLLADLRKNPEVHEIENLRKRLLDQAEKSYSVAQRVKDEKAKRLETEAQVDILRTQNRDVSKKSISIAHELEREKRRAERLDLEVKRLNAELQRGTLISKRFLDTPISVGRIFGRRRKHGRRQ